MRIGVLGASGYAGAELLRLLAGHPHAEVVLATGESKAGMSIAELVPALAGVYPTMRFATTDELSSAEVDVVFLALPHGKSQALVPALRDRDVQVVDLGADYRLRDVAVYEEYYGEGHRDATRLSDSVYALVERHREELAGAQLLAVPGCYPTATNLALGPFADNGWITPAGAVVNALSGVSGAGRSSSERLQFSRLHGNAEAYGLLHHRHTAEMEQELHVPVLFTPHLIPVSRGMLVTATAPLRKSATTDEALALLHDRYDTEPFVVVTDEPPSLKDATGSNLCFVSARVDLRTNHLLVMSAIDNLIKGAAGQAIQAWNVARGFAETDGLPRAGVTP